MIQGLWIIDNGGQCIYHKSYGKIEAEFDPDLTSAFFHALNLFSNKICDGTFDSVSMKGTIFSSRSAGGMTFIIASDEYGGSDKHLDNIITTVQNKIGEDLYLLNNLAMCQISDIALLEEEIDKIVEKSRTPSIESVGIIPRPKMTPIQILDRNSRIYHEMSNDNISLEVLLCIDGKSSISEIARRLNIESKRIMPILERGRKLGVIDYDQESDIMFMYKMLQKLQRGQMRIENAVDTLVDNRHLSKITYSKRIAIRENIMEIVRILNESRLNLPTNPDEMVNQDFWNKLDEIQKVLSSNGINGTKNSESKDSYVIPISIFLSSVLLEIPLLAMYLNSGDNGIFSFLIIIPFIAGLLSWISYRR